MASKPGILTEWPWTWLGNYKYAVLAPWAVHATYTYMVKDGAERDLSHVIIFPFLLTRMLHNQIWISYSRYRTAKGANRIVDKNIEFEQVDRERNWDDQIILNGLMFYVGYLYLARAHHLPWWRTDGVVWTVLLHTGPVEFLYYWLHPVVHPFGEHVAYFILFAIPLLTTVLTGMASLASFAGYITYIDFMNNMGHCNFEHIPKWVFSVFPPLKYLMYTPSYNRPHYHRYHSLHHTQFRTNYSLFMPLYDYIYGTMDRSSDSLYENSLVRTEESPDVVHLTHLTTPESIYHLRLGFAYLASEPHKSKWYLRLMWPVTIWSMLVNWMYGRTFIVERNTFKHLKLQTWAVPKYTIQYYMQWQRESINGMIEDAILEADRKGTKVLTLGLLNQASRLLFFFRICPFSFSSYYNEFGHARLIQDEGLNKSGELFLTRQPQLKVKVVDGSSLAVAIVLNSIPKGTTRVLLAGNLSKVAYSIALALCQGGIQVCTMHEDEYKKLKAKLTSEAVHNLMISPINLPKTWLVGDGLRETDQLKASKGTTFIPFSQFPPKKARKDCLYSWTPAMQVPKHLENVDSCENWLPRRVMSARRIAGIVHAAEEWNVHECGDMMFDIQKVWQAALDQGFRPLTGTTPYTKLE
ncbi:fatty acid hydroxylase superfamily [Striga asiatica]|uniref:Fatty acid hydroxylase superfamily n=1 Tax=Striga asiatica TaxID=4170 RepID=A0A5A7PQQ7_STRAF|nr:fatty acid hydroxylase superfamily [Striga asiatica]